MPLPGDPDALLAAAEDLRRAATGMTGARDAIAAHGRSTTARWDGVAAGRALTTIHQHATSTGRAADAATGAVAPLRTYAEELRRAQQDHLLGEQMVRDGQAALAGVSSGATAGADAAREAAHQAVTDGANTMLAAEERALAANQAAARAVTAATAQLEGIAPPPALEPVVGRDGAGVGAVLAQIGNAAASLGNAALNNPLDVGALAVGGALATVSAVGVAGSAAATATGPGAVVGLPLGGLSAAGVVAGAGIAGAGAIDLALHAVGDDRVAPFQVNEDTGTPFEAAPFEPPPEITGMTRHGEERAAGRDGGVGVSDEAMARAVAEPSTAPAYNPTNRTYKYEGPDAIVILNEAGAVVTTWPTHQTGYRN